MVVRRERTDVTVGGRAGGGDHEVAVVGAGAVGLTTAPDLAGAGVGVTVYERGTVAGGASGWAAGVCYDAFATRPNAELGATALERFREFAADGAPFTPCPYVWLARDGDGERAELVRAGIERMQEVVPGSPSSTRRPSASGVLRSGRTMSPSPG
jgi:sarcosine oxidase subunit beta